MAVTILETIKSAANAGNTAYIVILSLLCDTYSDLPTQYSMTGYELAQGCKAHVIDTNNDYMLDSSGTWHISGGEIWQNVYTKTETDTLLAGKQDTLTTAQLDAVNSGITAAKLTADEAALAELVDNGAKNVLKLTPSSDISIQGNVKGTINADGTVTIELTSGTSATNQFTWTLGTILPYRSKNLVLSGCPSGGNYSTGYALYLSISGSTSKVDTGTGVVIPADSTVTSSVIALIVRSGTVLSSPLTFKPMVCTQAAWGVSHEFVPYCPSMQEMYQMILALQ